MLYMAIKISQHVSLANYTSFHVGGNAEYLAVVSSTKELLEVLEKQEWKHIWLLGYGSNTLISDRGLPGLTVVIRGGLIDANGTTLFVDAGVWWDDVVKTAIDHELWGTELMSEIPGSVGAALFINITAYGQSIGPLVEWIEVWDKKNQAIKKYHKKELQWSYKSSLFQLDGHRDEVILRACLQLNTTSQDELVYQKALDVAEELNLTTTTLANRRKIIVEARSRAGSLWSPDDKNNRTAGSFFRNVMVSHKKALELASYDETGKTTEQIMTMNKVHGGDETRVSAAHVMLAAGFTRGQKFGQYVQLHDQNLLKIEALQGANAKNIYDAMLLIQQTVAVKLGVDLLAEAQLLGDFGS
jgi:UDP-N-acetylmuramate dehydrogenase